MDVRRKIEIAYCYKFFAECFYYPDENQLELLKKHLHKLPQSFDSLLDCLKNEKELQVDFSRLFLGPFKVLCPPYGSVYLEEGKTTQGASTLDVMRLYQSENLQVDVMEPADHIAIELEFMFYLISKEIEAIKIHDTGNRNLYLKKQYSLIERHLSQWVPEFSDLICANSNVEFYKSIGTKLGLMIQDELQEINNMKEYN